MRVKHISIAVLLAFCSCNKPDAPDCLKTTGKEDVESRQPGKFSAVTISGDMDLVIVQGLDYKLELKAGANLLKKIESSVNNGMLEIDNRNSCNFVRGYKKHIELRLTAPYLRHIISKSVGTISTEGSFNQDSIELNLQSVGDIKLNGSFKEVVVNSGSHGDAYLYGNTERLYVYTSGANFVHAEELISKDYVLVNTNDLGDCMVNVDQTALFEYKITNSGNIYYSGDAALMTNLGDGQAKGRLIKK
ncbi:MAG TPA: head GIN domain-containing protein [Bacteroidia bacterium]|nr:head GIN domain-containing protein [Bacteroidia bacterium]